MICDFFHENQLYQENLLIKYYQKKGFKICVIASKYTSVIDYYKEKKINNIKPSISFIDNIKLIRLNYKINFLNKLRVLNGLYKQIINEGPDIIYVHGFPLNLISSINYKKVKENIKIVYDSHADFSNSGTNWLSIKILHGLFYRFLFKGLIKKIDNFFYTSPQGGKFLNEIYKIPYKSMSLLPLGADLNYINKIKSKYSRSAIRKKIGITNDDFIVFTGGKLQPIKKTELVIQAVNILNNKKIHLLIIGESLDKSYKEKLYKLARNNPNIHFLGWVESDELFKYLYSSDLAVFPSSPSVLWQQSIGTGLPIIIGDEFGNAEYLNKNNNAIILNEKTTTVLNISDYINKLTKNKSLLNEMKKGADKTSNEFLSYEKIADQSINFNNR
tara:strand:+ start:775 stop:1935 length:1161 start_codon:yes stop_codon:yes gene_type:complete